MTPSRPRQNPFRNRLFTLGTAIFLPICILSIGAPLLTAFDPLTIDVANKLQSASWAHPFGTDEFGRDVLTRVLYGGRISLQVGGLATLYTAVLGIFFGALAGYYRILDALISRIVDALMIFPGLIIGVMIMAALGPNASNVILAMTILYTPRIVRVVRASVLEIKTQDYVDAARGLGASDLRLIVGHILPNSLAPLIVQVTFGFAWAILVESGLSFLGLGTPPPSPSWGNIISDGRVFVRTAPWLMVSAGLMISAAVMGLNLIGDGLRDLLDPRLRSAGSRIDRSAG
jgi:peptide/nickel transport system permease protein